jgi:hypothetical protein
MVVKNQPVLCERAARSLIHEAAGALCSATGPSSIQ